MAPSILSIEPTQHLYPAISCSSQKQFIQNKMYHLSFFSLFTYLPLKKKKRYHNDILWPSQIARHYLDSALCLSLTIQSAHPCCLPLWHTSQPCNWICSFPLPQFRLSFIQPFSHSFSKYFWSSISISGPHFLIVIIFCFVLWYYFCKI